MKILFVTNLPSPYRVDFFNELGKCCDLTVCYERHNASDRNPEWEGETARSFTEIFAKVKPLGNDKSIGFGIIHTIKTVPYDHLIVSGYASPSVMLAITYCRFKQLILLYI